MSIVLFKGNGPLSGVGPSWDFLLRNLERSSLEIGRMEVYFKVMSCYQAQIL